MYLRKLTFRLSVFLLGLGLCANSFSQARYNYVQRSIVKPGMAQEYESYMKKFVEAAKKLGYKLVDHKLELYGTKIKK